MSRPPIQVLLDGIEWKALPGLPSLEGELPVATHEGVLVIAGLKLRCYQLSDGSRVFDEESIRPFLEGPEK